MPRRKSPPPRMVSSFTINVWPKGVEHCTLADELDRIAGLLRQGYYSGEIIHDQNRGHWNTEELS